MMQEMKCKSAMEFTGERYVPEIEGQIALEHLHRYALACLLAEGKQVLDIACGEGYGSNLLAKVAASVIGVDISEEAINHAKSKYTSGNLEFRIGSVTSIPVESNSIDLVVSFETIEHIAQHEEMLTEIKRVLKPDGILIISSPNKQNYSLNSNYINPYHVKELFREEFEILIQRYFSNCRFASQSIVYGSLIFPYGFNNGKGVYFEINQNSEILASEVSSMYEIAMVSDVDLNIVESSFLNQKIEKSEIVKGLHVVLSEKENTISTLNNKITEHENQISNFRQELIARDAKIAGFNQLLAERDGQIASLSQTVSERDGQITSLSQTVSERDGQITSLTQTVSERDGQIRDLKQIIAERDAQIKNISVTVSDLLNSTSWKITKPLRLAKKCLDYVLRLIISAAGLFEDGVRFIYHRLPGSGHLRRRVKSILFKYVPFIFKRSKAYKAWEALYYDDGVKNQLQTKADSHDETKQCFPSMSEEYVPYRETPPPVSSVKLLAFYLPQFHPIPENDLWWGKGFTEWTNVTRATPQFRGHYQPHLPGELGFYDLRVPENQVRQAELARLYGIYGFCYHYYWFDGKRLLEKPLNQVLSNKEIDMPFCICWANENWSRRWDGCENQVLISQNYTTGYELAFIRDLEPVLRDTRYVCINNRPLIIVYRAELLPDPIRAAECWRSYCRKSGIGEIYLALTHSFEKNDPLDLGFDAAIEFPPNNTHPPVITHELQLLNNDYRGIVYDYRFFPEHSRNYVTPPYKLFRGVFPTWDNEARKPGRGSVFHHSSPSAYAEWLKNAYKDTVERFDGDERIVFLNAWNEWAEGCHLEPDQRYGYAYLETTKNIISLFKNDRTKRILFVSHDAGYFGAQLLSLNIVRELHEFFDYNVDVILLGGGPLRDEFLKFARVHDFFGPGFNRIVQDQILKVIFEEGARVAITSTVVTGKIVESLKLQGFKIVSLIHELPGIIKERNLEDALQEIADFADKIVFPAIDVSRKINELCSIDNKKAIIRPQGLFHKNAFKNNIREARRLFRSEFGMPDDAKIVMGMGYGDYRKGVDLFVEAGISMVGKNKGIYFVWFGSCDPEDFSRPKRLISERAADEWIIFPGERYNPDIYFSGADIFLLTSREDPFPSVVLSAMDTGLPVIGFKGSGGFCELLEAGGGILVPHGNIAEVTAAVDKLLEDSVLRQQTSDSAKKLIGDRFVFRDYVSDLLSYAEDSYFKVSVIIPNYNYESYLPKRLQSILDQTYRPYEIIFLDDCSTDRSINTAEEILKLSRIPFRIISNVENQGTFKQWIRGIREAKGDLVWIAEADDFCENNFLETVLQAFNDKEVVLSYCQSKQIDAKGCVIDNNYLKYTQDVSTTKWLTPYVQSGIGEICETLSIKNTIPNVSAVIMIKPDADALEKIFAEFKIAGDWMTYISVLMRGKIAYHPAPLNSHRRHSRGVTLSNGNISMLKEILSIQRLISQRFIVTAENKEKGLKFAQSVYEYLGLDKQGPKNFWDNPDLKDVLTN